MQIRPRIKSNQIPDQQNPVCRICLIQQRTKQLVSPCRCTGSLQFVHQDCIQTWILTKFSQVQAASCQLCSETYQMSYQLKTRCKLRQGIKKMTISKCFVCPFLLFLQGFLGLLIYLIILRIEDASSEKTRMFAVILLLLCFIAFLIIVGFSVVILNQIFLTKSMVEWIILPFQRNFDEVVQNLTAMIPGDFNIEDKESKMLESTIIEVRQVVYSGIQDPDSLQEFPEFTRINREEFDEN